MEILINFSLKDSLNLSLCFTGSLGFVCKVSTLRSRSLLPPRASAPRDSRDLGTRGRKEEVKVLVDGHRRGTGRRVLDPHASSRTLVEEKPQGAHGRQCTMYSIVLSVF